MPRVIKSPVERWQGTVTLCEPLDMEQVMAVEDAQDALTQLEHKSPFLNKVMDGKVELTWNSRYDYIVVPAVQKCVEKWDLDGFQHDPFQATPRNDSHTLINTLWAEVWKIYQGEQQIPNE